MRVKAELDSYENVNFIITINAKVSDWRSTIEQIDELCKAARRDGVDWPLSALHACIHRMLFDLDKTHADVLERPEK